jgi:hypothetical protein
MRASQHTTRLRYQALLTTVYKGSQMTNELIRKHGGQSCTRLVSQELGYLNKYGYWLKDAPFNDLLVDDLLESIKNRRRRTREEKPTETNPVDLFTKVENNELRDFIDKLKGQYEFSTETILALDIIKNHFRK